MEIIPANTVAMAESTRYFVPGLLRRSILLLHGEISFPGITPSLEVTLLTTVKTTEGLPWISWEIPEIASPISPVIRRHSSSLVVAPRAIVLVHLCRTIKYLFVIFVA